MKQNLLTKERLIEELQKLPDDCLIIMASDAEENSMHEIWRVDQATEDMAVLIPDHREL